MDHINIDPFRSYVSYVSYCSKKDLDVASRSIPVWRGSLNNLFLTNKRNIGVQIHECQCFFHVFP